MSSRKGISSFSVLLLTAVICAVALFCFPSLKVQYAPSSPGKRITVRYQMPSSSARVVEAEVTSVIEGALSGISSCSGVESESNDGGGKVVLTLKKRSDMDAVRFDVASRIRNIYPSLPQGCSYPSISVSAHGTKAQTAISYRIKSSLPTAEIASFIEDAIVIPLSGVRGVSSVQYSGQSPFEWVITFDSDLASTLSISSDDIALAFRSYYGEEVAGMVKASGDEYSVRVRNLSEKDFANIPVKKVGGRIVHLGDIASWQYREALPSHYFRLNGLNTITLSVEVSQDENLIEVVENVRAKMSELSESFPDEISASVGYDYSEYMSSELDKIYFRTFLCIIILLLFVLLVSRNWRYTAVIAVTLLVNLLFSVAVYYFSGLGIHIYTLAGITVSLGIIIDNSVVMIDHYVRHRDRSAFPALVAAVLTTVAALLAVLLLPEREKANLTDFSIVIAINLTVSLLVAYFFVPALLDYIPVMSESASRPGIRRLRRKASWGLRYRSYIRWGISHKWVFVVAIVVAFGIPTFLIPDKSVSWAPYKNNRDRVDKVVGSSFALFGKALNRSNFYREPTRPVLSVKAGMPEGCSVQQLDEVVRAMENYLSSFDEIEFYETRIDSYKDGTISVYFKPEFEQSVFPSILKSQVMTMASNFGGANWTVSGIDENYFNNNIVTDYKNDGIALTGYNYDELLKYADILIGEISTNRRVTGTEIWGAGYASRPKTEFCLDYDFEALLSRGISPYEYYSALSSPLCDESLGTVLYDGEYRTVRLESSSKESFDLWRVQNEAVRVGETSVKLSEIGSIEKRRTGLSIQKENQSYKVTVRYDFVGSNELARRFRDTAIDRFNGEILPIGFTASALQRYWRDEAKNGYFSLILLVIAAIFVICAIHFESLRLPLSVIFMIPISFIGTFLVFGLSDFPFDKGGFAAFVMLSGIAVNAGIYLISDWKADAARQGAVRRYLRSFSGMIRPIALTILSTVLGLVPFLFDGPKEVFWFDLAVGTMAGLLMSVVALVLYLPVFAIPKKSRG